MFFPSFCFFDVQQRFTPTVGHDELFVCLVFKISTLIKIVQKIGHGVNLSAWAKKVGIKLS